MSLIYLGCDSQTAPGADELAQNTGKDVLIPPHEPMMDAPGQSFRRRALRHWSPWRRGALAPHRNHTLFFGGSMTSMRRMPLNGRGHLYHHHFREEAAGLATRQLQRVCPKVPSGA